MGLQALQAAIFMKIASWQPKKKFLEAKGKYSSVNFPSDYFSEDC